MCASEPPPLSTDPPVLTETQGQSKPQPTASVLLISIIALIMIIFTTILVLSLNHQLGAGMSVALTHRDT